MNRPLVVLVATVIAAGCAALAAGWSRPTSDELGLLLTLIILGALAERYAVGLFHSDVSLGVVAVLVAAIVAGPWGVAIVAPPVVIAGQFRSKAAWYKRLYNVAVYALAGGAFAGIFHAFDRSGSPGAWPEVLAPALLGALANYAINSGLIAAAVAAEARESVLAPWRRNYQWLLPQYLIIGLAAIGAASAYQVLGIWGLLVFVAPGAGIQHALSLGGKAVEGRAVPLRRAA